MPNYGLVVTPEYSPMTFQEYAAPFEKYAEVYSQMADQYDALEMEASKWEKLANSTIDQAEYRQYQAYANSLRQVADELATTGLSTKTRGAVSDMKRRFAAEILPIEQAWNLREEERKFQKEAMARNPYIRFNRNASSTGLGSYMAGSPELSTIDLAQIKANVMNDAKPLAEELRDLQSDKVIKDSKWKKILGGQYWEFAKKHGFTSEAINQAITQMLDPRNNTSPEQFEILNTIVNGAVESSGVTSWDLYNNNDSFRREVLNAAASGLWQAVGTTNFEHLSNKNWELQNSGSRNKETSGYPINPVSIYTQRQRNEDEKAINEFESKGYIDTSGKLTKKAIDEILNPIHNPNPVTSGGAGGASRITTEQNESDSDLFNIVYRWAQKDKPDINKEQFRNVVQSNPDYVVALYNRMKENNLFIDMNANLLHEYNYHLDPTEQTNYKNLIKGTLYEVDFDEVTNTWKNTGNELSLADFSSDTYTVVDTNFGVYGNTIIIRGPEGVKEYRMPTNINPTAETNRDMAVQAASLYGQALQAGKELVYDPNIGQYIIGTTPLTEEDKIKYQEEKERMEQNAYQYHSMIGYTNQSKPVTYVPTVY